MKKFSSIILTLAALAFAAVSCVEEPTPYEPGEPEESGCYGVYFPVQDAMGSHTLTPADPTCVDIEVKRTNASGAINVPYIFSSEEQIFSAGEIAFADGSETAYLHVDFASAAPGAPHMFSVQIQDPKYASKYFDGAVALDYNFMIVEWKEFFGKEAKAGDMGHIYQITWEEDYDTQMFYYETSYPNIRFCKLVEGWHGNVQNVDYEFYWDTKTNNLYVPHQWIGYTRSDGLNVYTGAAPDFYDQYKGWGEVVPSQDYFDWAPAWIAKNGFFQPFYDGNGNFYLADWLYLCNGSIPTGNGYQFGGDSEADADLFMAPGFIRTDYSLEIEADYPADGVLPVYITAGADVPNVKIAGFEGELTATQIGNKVAAIIAGTEAAQDVSTAEFETDEDGMLVGVAELSFPATGVYTIVAISYDENGAAQASASVVQFYVSADDAEDYAVEVSVGAEATPARYKDYDTKSSFAFYILGKDVTAANVDVFEAAKYAADPDKYNAQVKADEDAALDEAAVAAINGAGGFYAVFAKLAANTEYTVVVWATNGSEEAFVTANYKTDGLPNEVVKEGAAYCYTIVLNEILFDTEDPAYDEGLNLEYNPNTKGYEIPHWGNDVTLKFDVVDGVPFIPIQKIGVSISGYGEFYVMDVSLCDTFFGAGAADYFGYDTTQKGSIDEDGNYHFAVHYACSEGYTFGAGEEILYVDGAPAEDEGEEVVSQESYQVQYPVQTNRSFGEITIKQLERELKSVSMEVISVKAGSKQTKANNRKPALRFFEG